MSPPSDERPVAAPADELVHLTRRDDGVAVITLDHPKANTLSVALLERLRAVALELAADLPGRGGGHRR